MGQVTDLGYESSYSGDQIDGYLGMVAAANTIGGAGVAAAGFGFDGISVPVIRADSAGESYETYCAKVDSVLAAMALNTTKVIVAYPPAIFGGAVSVLSILYKGNSNARAVLCCLSSVFGDYGGWRMRKWEGVWQPFEWVNPPLVSGTEYRTTERHGGKPVYAYMVALERGWSPDRTTTTGTSTIPHGISNIETVVDIKAWRGSFLTPTIYNQSLSNEWSAYVVDVNSTNIRTYCGTSTGGGNFRAVLKYTKTTD